MAQSFCVLRAMPRPFTLYMGGSPTTSVEVSSQVLVVWADATIDTWAATNPVLATNAYGGNLFDTTALAWLLVALKGVAAPAVLKEMDFGTIDTVLAGATWGLLARIETVSMYRVAQV